MKAIILSTLLLLATVTLFGQSTKKTTTTTQSSSVSISNSDNDYTLLASFNSTDAENLKKIIADALGSGKKTGSSSTLWQMKDVYTVTLKPEKLVIEMSKDKASGSLYNTFIKLGKDIQQAITNKPSAPKAPETPVK